MMAQYKVVPDPLSGQLTEYPPQREPKLYGLRCCLAEAKSTRLRHHEENNQSVVGRPIENTNLVRGENITHLQSRPKNTPEDRVQAPSRPSRPKSRGTPALCPNLVPTHHAMHSYR